jgi:uncharacterized membrane protein
MSMRTWLCAAAFVWPVVLAGAVAERAAHPAVAWPTAVYLVASRICHQRPDRSFATAGIQWPVCARCAGLYLAAPLGVLVAAVVTRRRGRARVTRLQLAVAAAPTALTIALEWSGLAPIGNAARFAAALPLGAALAALVIDAAAPERSPLDDVGPKQVN